MIEDSLVIRVRFRKGAPVQMILYVLVLYRMVETYASVWLTDGVHDAHSNVEFVKSNHTQNV